VAKDIQAKLEHGSGKLRLVVRVKNPKALEEMTQSVTSAGAFSIVVDEPQPTTLVISVLLRTARRGEQFRGKILAWSNGRVVLQPQLPDGAFGSLSESLLAALWEEMEHVPNSGNFGVSPESLEDTSPPARPDSGAASAIGGVDSDSFETERVNQHDPPEPEPEPDPAEGADSAAEAPAEEALPVVEETDDSDWPVVSDYSGFPPGVELELEVADDEPEPREETSAVPRVSDVMTDDETDYGEWLPDPEDIPAVERSGSKTPLPLSVELFLDSGLGSASDTWHRVRTGQTRVPPNFPPQARPGAFSPPQESDSSPKIDVHDFAEPSEAASIKTDSHPEQIPNLESELIGAHLFLNRLERDEESVIQDNDVSGRGALESVRSAAEWRPGAVLIASRPESGTRWYLFTAAGKIVNAYRLPPSSSFSIVGDLISKGLLSTEAGGRVLKTAREYGLSEETSLARHKLLDSEMLKEAVVRRVRGLTSELLSLDKLQYRLYRLKRFPRESRLASTEIDTYNDLFEQFSTMAANAMADRESEIIDRYLLLQVRPDLLSHTLALSAEHETFVAKYLSGSHQLLAVYSQSQLPREAQFGIVSALAEMNLVRFSDAPAQRRLTRIVNDDSDVSAMVELRASKGAPLDDFEYLGLTWWATSSEVDESIAQIEQSLSPQRLATVPQHMERSASQVLTAARKAYGHLRTSAMRKKAREPLMSGPERHLALELLEAQYRITVFRGQLPKSDLLAERISELDSNLAEQLKREALETTLGN